jgi:DNA-binding winged helix-turn-helix (wHTH) protein
MAQNGEHLPQMRETPDLHFGAFRLESTKRLWRDGQLLPVRPRPLAVLRYLAERAGQLVIGEELLQHV